MEKELKNLILSRYKSMTAFAAECGIPYTTIITILNKGIQNAGLQNVVKICETLSIDVEALANGRIEPSKPDLANPEVAAELEMLQVNPNLKVLVTAGAKLSKSDIDFLTEMIEHMQK